MNKKVVIIGLALTVSALGLWAFGGCVPLGYAEDEYKEALPLQEDLVVKIGEQDVVEGETQQAELDPFADCDECCIVDDGGEQYYVDGELYQLTKSAKRYVNGALVTSLGWVAAIVVHPFSEETESGYVWGPWQESLARIKFRFVMDKTASQRFEFRLEGININDTSDNWTPVVIGDVTATDVPHHGFGTMTFDYDAVHAIDSSDPSPDAGRIIYEWDVRDYPYMVDVTFQGFEPWDQDGTIDATYAYRRYDEGMAGSFEFSAEADFWPEDAPDGVVESFAVESRWDGSGEGIAAASVSGGTLDEEDVVSFDFDECWADADGLFYATYERNAITWADETVYDEVLCGEVGHCPIIL